MTSIPNRQNPSSDQPWNSRFCLLCCILLTLFFTGLIYQFLCYRGRLLLIPTYDDASYLCDGLHSYNIWLKGGTPALFQWLWKHPPHTPFSTAIAFVSYAVLGAYQGSPYLGNAVIIFVMLIFVCYLMRNRSRIDIFLALLFTLSIPLAGSAIAEFRPDVAGALFTAITVILLIDRPLQASNRRLLTAGLFLAAALLIKPSAFPNTLALGFAALGLTILRQLFARRRRLEIVRDTLFILCPLLLAFPYYIRNGGNILGYIYHNTWGSSQALWLRQMDTKSHLLFYLTGPGGHFMLGLTFYLLLIVSVAGGAFLLLTRRTSQSRLTIVSFTLVLILSLAIPIANPVKQEFFGCNFQMLLIFAAILAFRALLNIRLLGRTVLCASLAFTLTWFQWPNTFGEPADPVFVSQNAAAHGINDLILRNIAFAPHSRVYIGAVSTVSSDALRFLALQRVSEAPEYVMPFEADPATVATQCDHADFVIATDDGVSTNSYPFPANLLQQQTLDAVRARSDYYEIGFFPFTESSGYHVFQHLLSGNPFRGLTAAKGLGAPEGPYPTWTLPVVRWGCVPETSVPLPSGNILIFASSLSQVPDQIAEFIVDGKPVQHLEYPKLNTFYNTRIELALPPGKPHLLSIHYRTFQPGTNHAVLFSRLSIFNGLPSASYSPTAGVAGR